MLLHFRFVAAGYLIFMVSGLPLGEIFVVGLKQCLGGMFPTQLVEHTVSAYGTHAGTFLRVVEQRGYLAGEVGGVVR